MKINEFFQKGYYINLDRRTDRRLEFENEMSNVGLLDFFERISAEDGINEKEIWKKHYYCAMTYMKLYEKIYDEGYEYFVIFEDDAQFYNHEEITGIELAEKALDELNNFSDWDMIYFGGYPRSTMELVSPHLAVVEDILTTHAIGYKRSVIESILGKGVGNKYTLFYDAAAIDGWLGSISTFKKYLINPISVIQRHSTSDLDAWGHKANAADFLRDYNNMVKIKLY